MFAITNITYGFIHASFKMNFSLARYLLFQDSLSSAFAASLFVAFHET